MASVSIITTFFNETPEVLQRAVLSILNQDFKDFEYIIVPGNPENTAAITFLKERNDPRIRLIEPGRKEIMTVCLNLAIKSSSASYIALQEADDESLPERMQVQYDFMQAHPEVDVCGTAIRYVDEVTKKDILIRRYPVHPSKQFLKYAAIAHPTIMAKREVYDKFGFYSEDIAVRNSPDYELWLRWLSQGVRFYNIDKVLFNYYQSANNGRNRNVKPTLQSVIRLKNIYKSKLPFSLSDHLYLWAEKALLLVPSKIISNVFYYWTEFNNSIIQMKNNKLSKS